MSDLNVDIQFSRKGFDLDVQFALKNSHVTVILGKSGSGKSTLLRLLAGLEVPNAGIIKCNGETWVNTSKNINFRPQQRVTGFVFQDYALFENMSVVDNIGFGVEKGVRNKVVSVLVEKLELSSVKDSYPSQLSGGQKQRVALGRALAIKPNLLLLDEPLSSIDFNMRKKLQRELKNIIRAIDCPVILVTHDLNEARLMADNLIVMDEGKHIRSGVAPEVFTNPVNKRTAHILGWQNFLPIKSLHNGYADTKWGRIFIDTTIIPDAEWLTIKPERIRFGIATKNSLSVTITEIEDYGAYKEFRCQVDDSLSIIVHRPSDEPTPSVNSVVNLHLSSSCLMLVRANTSTIEGVKLPFKQGCYAQKVS